MRGAVDTSSRDGGFHVMEKWKVNIGAIVKASAQAEICRLDNTPGFCFEAYIISGYNTIRR